jgi:hypothetical protein
VRDLPRQSWLEAEPERLVYERHEMERLAPEMAWIDLDGAGGWAGYAPGWPFEREAPAGLVAFLGGRRLKLLVAYSQAYPAVPPALFPLDPEPPLERRLLHRWHLNGDGSICVLQSLDHWSGREATAELVIKASGWFIEYLLVDRELCDAMSENGIAADPSLDHLLTS